RFALELAAETDGAFDQTIGNAMVEHGFATNYRTGERITAIHALPASYVDVELDTVNATITLHRDLQLDLGAVAKAFAADLPAQELAPFENFAVNAGGDMFLGGHNESGDDWSVGIRHPRDDSALIDTVRVRNQAVCTSGDYERRSPRDGTSH